MKKLECLQETSIWLDQNKRELYEDGFGYTYEVDEAKAAELLAMKNEDGLPCFKQVE